MKLVTLALFFLAASVLSAETYQDAKTGYSVEIPTGWRHKVDAKRGALLLAAPGGLKVRLRAGLIGGAVDQIRALRAMKKDMKRLKRTFRSIDDSAEPFLEEPVGGIEAWRWEAALTDKRGKPVLYLCWFAGGPSEYDADGLKTKIEIMARPDALDRHAEGIGELLENFRWPGVVPAPVPVQQASLPHTPAGHQKQDFFAAAPPAWMRTGRVPMGLAAKVSNPAGMTSLGGPPQHLEVVNARALGLGSGLDDDGHGHSE